MPENPPLLLLPKNNVQPGSASALQEACIPGCWETPEMAWWGGAISPVLTQGSLTPLSGSQGLVSQRSQNRGMQIAPAALLLGAHLLPL